MTEASARVAQHRLGLRARTALAFAILALVLSGTLALLTYGITRWYLIDRREELAARQAFLNARVVATVDNAGEISNVLDTLPSASASSAVYRSGRRWYSTSVAAGRADIPTSVIDAARSGDVARQRVEVQGDPALVVGIPVGSDATYFEVFSLLELERTLRTIAGALVAAALATTAAGALLGLLASRRVVRPLSDVAATARSIADGDLERRLRAEGDRDLAPLVDAFNEMVDALETRIEAESRFAGDVTHELRTPLAALSAAVAVLDRRVGPEGAEALEVVSAQIHRFQQLVVDLLDISRFDAHAEHLELENTDPGRFVAAVTARSCPDVPVEVMVGTPDQFPLDRRRIERVLQNLLENATRYGGGALRVEVRGQDGGLRVAVEDAGPGIPPEETEAIFERFHRVQRQHDGRGTGLGLAIVAEHCALHGGTVRVENRCGGGARFVVELPAP